MYQRCIRDVSVRHAPGRVGSYRPVHIVPAQRHYPTRADTCRTSHRLLCKQGVVGSIPIVSTRPWSFTAVRMCLFTREDTRRSVDSTLVTNRCDLP
jgi:hypothetical protein